MVLENYMIGRVSWCWKYERSRSIVHVCLDLASHDVATTVNIHAHACVCTRRHTVSSCFALYDLVPR